MRTLALLLFAACSPKPLPSGDDTAQDSGAPQDTDTGPVGTDADGDGWTVEEGDCDDNSIYVNPAWDEDPTDGIDNDCDTRVDEVWSGVTVAYTNGVGAASLVTIDQLGQLSDTLTLDSDCSISWLAPGALGGWVTSDGATVSAIATDGSCTELADFSESDYGVYGVAAHPDGYAVATSLDGLWEIDPDGTATELATWNADFMDVDNFQLAVYTVAVDLRNGTVGLFDYFGGFATWNPTDGLVILKQADLNNVPLTTYSGTARDGGGWAVAAVDSGGAYGVYDFDLDTNDWTQTASWTDDQWTPSQITTDGDSGDAYATATAGWYSRVWRIRYVDGSVAKLYETDGSEEYRNFAGIVANYQ